MIPSNNPAHQEIYQTCVMIDPILYVHVVSRNLLLWQSRSTVRRHERGGKGLGLRARLPRDAGLCLQSCPCQAPRIAPLCSLPTAAHLTLTRPCPSAAILAASEGRSMHNAGCELPRIL